MKKTIYIIGCIMISLFLIQFSSAYYEWESYGGNTLHAGMRGEEGGYSILNQGWDLNFLPFYHFETEFGFERITPLVINQNIEGTEENVIILQSNNYTRIIDQNFNLISEKNTGYLLTNLDALEFWNNSSHKDIAGVFRQNATTNRLKVFTLNPTTSVLEETFNYDFPVVNYDTTAGIRHIGNTLYFVYDYPAKFVEINRTTTNIVNLPNQTLYPAPYIEPLSFADATRDGEIEFMTFNNDNLVVFKRDGEAILNYTTPDSTIPPQNVRRLRDAKFYAPDGENNLWQIVIAEGEGYFSSPNHYGWTYITSVRLDGSTRWEKEYVTLGMSFLGGSNLRIAISDDYTGNGKNDVYVLGYSQRFTTTTISDWRAWVFEGTTGTELTHKGELDIGVTGIPTLSVADMNRDGKDDFVFSIGNHVFIHNPVENSTFFETDYLSGGNLRCVLADIRQDTFLDIVCIGSGSSAISLIISSPFENENAEIQSVMFDPSTNIQVGTTLYAFITATDNEGDQIYYAVRCADGENFTNDTISSVKNCYYGEVGNYNLTIRVRDEFHSEYDTLSQIILVTTTGEPPPITNETAQVEGGIAIPLQLVDTDNYNRGFLPEVYFGTIGFLSYVLQPFIVLVLGFFIVMIIITIGTIAVKLLTKRIG